MINVSSAFKERMIHFPLLISASATLADSTLIAIPANKIMPGATLTESGGASGFPLGAAISRTVDLQLANRDGAFNNIEWVGAALVVTGTLDIGNSQTESINYGTFYVRTPAKIGRTVNISVSDAMTLAETPWETSLTFPTTLGAIWSEVAAQIGVTAAPLTHGSVSIPKKPSGVSYTCREIIGYVAMLEGGNARISRSGVLEAIPYSFPDYEQHPELFQDLALWADGVEVATEPTTITGIVLGDEFYGTDGYALEVMNPLTAGWEATAAQMIGSVVVGHPFYRFSGQHKGWPIAEFMDPAHITVAGESYDSVITDYVYVASGYTDLANSAEEATSDEGVYQASTSLSERINNLYAQEITVSGQLHSPDYVPGNNHYAQSGLGIDFAQKLISSPDFAVEDGQIYARGGEIAGAKMARESTVSTYTSSSLTMTDGNGDASNAYSTADNVTTTSDEGTLLYKRSKTGTFSGTTYTVGRVWVRVVNAGGNRASNVLAPSATVYYYAANGTTVLHEQEFPVLDYQEAETDTGRSFTFTISLLEDASIVGVAVSVANGDTCELKWEFGAWDAIYYGESNKLSGDENGVYFGSDGISVGDKIELTPAGTGVFDRISCKDMIYRYDECVPASLAVGKNVKTAKEQGDEYVQGVFSLNALDKPGTFYVPAAYAASVTGQPPWTSSGYKVFSNRISSNWFNQVAMIVGTSGQIKVRTLQPAPVPNTKPEWMEITRCLSYAVDQGLSAAQRYQARENMGLYTFKNGTATTVTFYIARGSSGVIFLMGAQVRSGLVTWYLESSGSSILTSKLGASGVTVEQGTGGVSANGISYFPLKLTVSTGYIGAYAMTLRGEPCT